MFVNTREWSEAVLQYQEWVREWLSPRVPPTAPPVRNRAVPVISRATARVSIAVHSVAAVPVP